MRTIFIIYNLQTKLLYNLQSAIQYLFLWIITQFFQFFCMGPFKLFLFRNRSFKYPNMYTVIIILFYNLLNTDMSPIEPTFEVD
jgi:hypothetical protein